MSEEEELVDIVNSNNYVIGQGTRGEVYSRGLLHRASHILIRNSQGQIYLQKRSKNKKNYPGFWDISSSEHLKVGETFEEAARRGLKEELGIEVHLKLIRPVHHQISRLKNNSELMTENELVELFIGIYDGEIKFDKEEISDGRLFTVYEIDQKVQQKLFKFTPWFLEEWDFLRENSSLLSV